MPPTAAEKELTDLLQQLAKNDWNEITPDHVQLLQYSLIPSAPRSQRSLAYICLTKIVENAQSHGDRRDAYLAKIFQPVLEVFHRESTEEDSDSHLPPTYLLTSLFPLAPAVSSGLVTSPLSAEKDAPDALAVLLELAELDGPIQLALAELLAAAAGTKEGRGVVRTRCMEWLNGALRLKAVGGICAVALSKLGREAPMPGEEGKDEAQVGEMDLCDTMVSSLIAAQGNATMVLPILEGLSILSTKSYIKHHLSSDATFLKSLLSLSPTPQIKGGSLPVTPRSSMPSISDKPLEPTDTSLCYGITTILVNLSSRKPVLSAEDEQIAKLRAMAISGKRGEGSTAPDPLEEVPARQERVGRLYDAGIVGTLRGLGRAESVNVKGLVGILCLNLVEDKERRMGFIRDGGFKTLSEVIRKLLDVYDGTGRSAPNPISTSQPDGSASIDILPACQALAKLIIPTPPTLLFPPPHQTSSLNALTPLYHLLTHPSSSLLQTFESLMALTNLASISPGIADRIVGASIASRATEDMWRGVNREKEDTIRVMGKVEEAMMDDNELVRRAATELICNLAGSEKGFNYLSGESDQSRLNGRSPSGRVKSRLNLLMILTDSDDLATRLAAGGALAILTESSSACSALLHRSEERADPDKSAWKRLVTLLKPEEIEEEDGERITLISTIPPDEGMIFRAVCILLNLLQYVQGMGKGEKEREMKGVMEEEVGDALKGVLGLKVGDEVLKPVLECLHLLKKL